MNLDFSDDQKFLQAEARKFFDKEGGLLLARKVMDNDAEGDQELWKKIIDLGWTGIRIPEEHGGLGLGHLELCVIAEEIGRSLAPIPFSSSVYLFTEAIINFANDDIKAEILPKLVTGECVGTFAIAEDTKKITPNNITCLVDGDKISGSKIAVPDVGFATHAIVLVKKEKNLELRLVNLADSNVEKKLQKNIDKSRSFYQLNFNGCDSQKIHSDEDAWDLSEHLLDQAAVMFAFEQVGGAEQSLDMAKNYALERYAFGRQIGSYQAIKHKLADMYISLTLARSNCYYGAWALSSDSPELKLAAATSRVSATKAFQLCAKENIQTHGGNGFTWEYDCHLFYKRSKVLSVNIGSELSWKEKLVSAMEKMNTLENK